jgi:hypothetical protein
LAMSDLGPVIFKIVCKFDMNLIYN